MSVKGLYLMTLVTGAKMTQLSSVNPRPRHLLTLLVTASLATACTLDFEDFRPYTEEGLRDRPDEPVLDMSPPDEGVDMIMPLVDMMPPLLDMDPPVDTDEDGLLDDEDNCPLSPNPDQRDSDMNGVGDACDDADQDGVVDYRYDPDAPEPYGPYDNCLGLPNPDQSDLDLDGEGDACDPDADGDGLDAPAEAAIGANPLKSDSDDDGWRDDVDLCPLLASRSNRDLDRDGEGDDCDSDDDDDGVYDWLDSCPYAPNPEQLGEAQRGAECANDADSDGVTDAEDPCPFEPNVEGVTAACELGVVRWGYEGDHYDLELNPSGELFSGTRGGLRLLSAEGSRSWGEESGLPARYVKRFKSVEHSRLAGWIQMSGTNSLGALRWDEALSEYFVIELSLLRLGVAGAVNSISAYGEYVWVGTDQGLYRVGASGGEAIALPIGPRPISALYTSSTGDTLIGAGSALLLAPAEGEPSLLGELLELGEIQGIKPMGEGRLGLLGSLKTLVVASPQAGVELEQLMSLSLVAQDVIARPDGDYYATNEGVVWVDSYGRSFLPNTRQIGGGAARSLERAEAPQRFWVGAAGAATEANGLWNGLPVPDEYCVRDHARDGSYWWAATPTGLYRLSPTGEKQSYGQGSFYAIAQTAAGLWSANESSLIYVSPEESVTYPLPEGLNPPVKAIAELNGQLALGGLNSIAFAALNNGELGPWSVTAASGDPLPYGQIEGIHVQAEGSAWVAVRGDPLQNEGGVALFDIAQGGFVSPPNTVANGQVNSHELYDIDGDGALVGTAADLGARVFNSDVPNSVSNISLNSGLPNEVGNSNTLSLDLSSDYLFLSVRPTAELQPYGSIVRFNTDPAGDYPIDFLTAVLYASSETDILTVPEGELSSTQLHDLLGPSGAPQVSYSSCGTESSPGLIGLLDGTGGVYQRVSDERLKYPGAVNILTPSPGQHPTWAQAYLEADGSAKVYLTDLADVYPDPYMIADPRPRRQVPNLDRAIRQCHKYQVGEQYTVECLFEGNYFGTNINGSWNVYPEALFGGAPTEIRGFAIDETKPATVRWYATDRGLIQRRSPTAFNENFTIPGAEGEPEITNLYTVLQSERHGLVLVGSDRGLNFSPSLAGEITQELWTSVPELKGAKVYDLAVSPSTGELWVASERGLYKVSISDAQVSGVSRYGVEVGLPSGAIKRVAITESGLVYALHQSGLSRYDTGEWSHYGPRMGAPSDADQLLIAGGYLWVGGPQGVSRFSY